MRPVALGWLFAVAAMSILIGSVAQSATKAVSGSKAIEEALGRLGGHGSLVALYLGLTFLMLAMLIALVAAGQIVAIRTEEADGRLENLVVRPLSRTSWFAGRLGLSVLLLIVAGLLSGVGAWIGAASQHSGIRFGSLLAAGLNLVAAVALPPRARGPGLRRLAATHLGGRLRISGLVVSARVHRRRRARQSLAARHVGVLPHGARLRRPVPTGPVPRSSLPSAWPEQSSGVCASTTATCWAPDRAVHGAGE